jgi:hypothetical protein
MRKIAQKNEVSIMKLSARREVEGKLMCRLPRRACSAPFTAGGLAQGPQKLWDKWCKILHSRLLLALNFIIETSFFCTIFLIFSAKQRIDSDAMNF